MAATAAKKRKKPKSYANVVKAAEEKNDFFTLAECNLKRPNNMPNGRIPNTKEEFSFFIAGIAGVNIRDDLWVIKFICESAAALEMAMNTTFLVEGKKPFVAILPHHKTNKQLLIKVANMPFGKENKLRKALVTHWSTLGTVINAKLYKFPGRPWLTKHWDILLQLPDGVKKLKAPLVFNLFGYVDTMISSWNGAKKACLHCKTAGHSSTFCPAKKPENQKVGASTNPPQMIGSVGQDRKGKNKETEVSLGSVEKLPASESSLNLVTKPAAVADSATVAQQIQAP